MRGLLTLTWLEIKIFVREPMGVFGTVGMPVIVFVVITRLIGGRIPRRLPRVALGLFDAAFVPVLASMLIAVSAVISLVTVISIYREAGILKRLRATPLRPQTILTAHVLVKLLFTFITAALLVAAGRRYYPVGAQFPAREFVAALILATWSILSIGFLIASVVPTARFAQPLAAAVLYPMLAVSGLFVPFDVLPDHVASVARALPLSHAVSLLSGIWHGHGWDVHRADLVALVLTFLVCTALSSIVFRWE
jgi:ABC-2 type transport system permease protein